MAAKKNGSGLDTQDVIKKNMSVCDNLSETAIQVTESKARLAYRNHIKVCSGERVLSFLGLSIAFFIAVLTSSFKDIFGIKNSSYVLCACFWIAAIGFAIATMVAFIIWLKNFRNCDEDAFITALKGE